jgi:hypothetical protein
MIYVVSGYYHLVTALIMYIRYVLLMAYLLTELIVAIRYFYKLSYIR